MEEIKVSGMPLGLIDGTRYDVLSLDLQVGDIVVFASDGTLECQNSQQEAFGASRLVAVLGSFPEDARAKDISTAILTSIDRRTVTRLPEAPAHLLNSSGPGRAIAPIWYHPLGPPTWAICCALACQLKAHMLTVAFGLPTERNLTDNSRIKASRTDKIGFLDE